MRATFWKRHQGLKWFAFCCAGLLICFSVVAVIAVRRAEPLLRALIVAKLEQRFHSRVELASFHIFIAKGLRAEGKGLRIWPPAQVAGNGTGNGSGSKTGKPLIEIADFRFRAPLHYSGGKPIRISRIELRGLTIDIPPQTHWMPKTGSAASGARPAASAPPAPPGASAEQPAAALSAEVLHFRVDTILCNGATVILENKDPAKLPLVFAIETMKVMHLRPDGAMDFEARLTNPKPRGTIVTKGSIGPWQVNAPALTPLHGKYSFEHADLGSFRGISGTLNSTGFYQGELGDMTVDGVTDTPDFALTSFGTPLPLHTVFHATVDATNGDTWLEPVDARLGSTEFVARGKIVTEQAVPGGKGVAARPAGHEIDLKVNVDHGQIGDFLRLTSHHDTPMMTGMLHMQAALKIPPGKSPVHERLLLNGKFLLDDAQFTDAKIQERVGELSMRGRGKPKEAKSSAAAEVVSTMTSSFSIADAVVSLPDLKYTVPGAVIDLKGNYDIDGGGLNFNGHAILQATVSQMVGGWKGVLLSPLDRFFKKDGGGTMLRVHVGGTRKDPHFGVDF